MLRILMLCLVFLQLVCVFAEKVSDLDFNNLQDADRIFQSLRRERDVTGLKKFIEAAKAKPDYSADSHLLTILSEAILEYAI
ncbi:hypothetical protein [Pseudothermotoga thermarum]|uniref:hypothetical protein n=1 Tax=Pseudothermotoga thermarum TaxID=119394 RepID=UPI001B7FD0A5|nr:hypothetical protein [Pseudothermotoga thermarum]